METGEPTFALPTNATDPTQGLASTPLPRSATASAARLSDASDITSLATVIVAEPDTAARNSVLQALKEAGIQALGLSNLEEVRLLLRSGGSHIRIIVLGVDDVPPDDPALKEILAFGNQSSLAILVYASATASQTILHLHCLNHGAVDFIRKSPDTSNLLAVVRQVKQRQEEGGEPTVRWEVGNINAGRPMDGWVELTAASSFEYLRRIQRFIALVLARRLPPEVCDDIRIILEEAGRNAIEWGNRFNTKKTFRISYRHLNDRVILKFEDEGEGFDSTARVDPTADPEHLAKREAAGKRPGGYGIHMLHELMDEVVYSEKGNVVVMTKYLTLTDA